MSQMNPATTQHCNHVCRHGKNINSDMWRQMQLWRGAGNPAHPFSRFHTGNHETLMTAPKVLIDYEERLSDLMPLRARAQREQDCVFGKQWQ